MFSVAPQKDPAFKELLILVRSGSVDDVERTFLAMDSAEKAKRWPLSVGNFVWGEFFFYCDPFAILDHLNRI